MADWLLPVRLAYAIPYNFSTGGASFSQTYVRVKVGNLAFDKQVTLHYRDVVTWRNFALPWTANYGRYDVFSSSQAPYTETFAMSYTVGNQTYWDNNYSFDYTLPNFHSTVGGHVMLRRVSFALAGARREAAPAAAADHRPQREAHPHPDPRAGRGEPGPAHRRLAARPG
jgi:hypothetical protein